MIFSPCVYSINNKIEVVNITGLELTKSEDEDIVNECKKWKISKEDVEKIFKNSKEYEYYPYDVFYQTPCNINGEAKINNKMWSFYINGGGITTLENNKESIYLGCSSKECESFFIFPLDGMNP